MRTGSRGRDRQDDGPYESGVYGCTEDGSEGRVLESFQWTSLWRRPVGWILRFEEVKVCEV